MNVRSATLAYFSPTHTTQKVLEGIGRGLQVEVIVHLDLTLPRAAPEAFVAVEGEVVVLGAPVYGGRVPPVATARLRTLRGHGTPAVVVVLYGNREYEDALVEMVDLAEELGFRPVAGAAFLGEHSFSTEDTPIAHGQPDAADLAIAEGFGRGIRQMLEAQGRLEALLPLQVPGKRPYKPQMAPLMIAPVVHEEICTLCRTCAQVCPTEAVHIQERVSIQVEACIACCACVKSCPTGACRMEDPRALRGAKRLATEYAQRKAPEMYVQDRTA